MCTPIDPPGLHIWVGAFHGNLEAVTYAYYDYPDMFEELHLLQEAQALKKLEMVLDAGTDSVLTGGSGSITLQSPEIWRKLSLPTIRKITRICREAGVISGIHSCGASRYLIETCAKETDLDYVNPLEIPPMGDCQLEEVASSVGGKLCLMGNLHTTEVMLNGTPERVRLESLKAIKAAGRNGGFVLSTGDQCGRDTPDENIREMVRTVKEFGSYPLDMDRIDDEIKKLNKPETFIQNGFFY
jgi:uroporphyrinogen decarboxylase